MAKSQLQPTRSASKPSTPIKVEMDTLTQGRSQQPEHLRIIGQCQEQINGWSSSVEGLTKRNPARFTAKIADEPLTNFYLEMFQISKPEIYSILLKEGSTTPGSETILMQVLENGRQIIPSVHGTGISIDGSGLITITPENYLYAAAQINNQDRLFDSYQLISSGPLGLLLNRTKEVAMSSETTSARTNEGVIFVSAVAFSVTYTVTLSGAGSSPTFSTPAATDDNNNISTSQVASSLATQINAIEGWTATQSDYVVIVSKDDGSDFEMTIDDSRSNTLATAYTDEISSLSQLPKRCSNGYKVNFTSDPTTDIDDRWLEFATFDGTDIGEGNWSECVAPEVAFKLDDETMPYVLYRKANSQIFIGPADGSTQTLGDESYTFPTWGERTAGDEKTVPNPDFVGIPLRDHCFYNQRYVVAGGEVTGFSETDDVFNFFADSAAALVDSDAFYVRCTSEVSSPIEWLLPIDESLLIWSRTSQFQCRPVDGEVIAPSTAIVVRLSNIEMNPHVRPKLAAAKVLFSTDEFGYTHFREYEFFNSRNQRLGLNLGGSSDVTGNLPKFIKGMVSHWDVGEAVDFAVARTPEHPDKLYVYKYKWQATPSGLQKQQAAWSEWRFGGDVQWVKFMQNKLWVLLSYEGRTDFVEILCDELEDLEEGIQIHLDRLLLYPEVNLDFQTSNNVTATYDTDTDKTTFVLPYAPVSKVVAVVRFVNGENQGVVLGTSTTNTIVCELKGDWTEEMIAFGEEYEFKYEFTRGYVMKKDTQGTRLIGDLSGRTQIHTWTVFHKNTGYYEVKVSRLNRKNDSLNKFQGNQLNVQNNTLDGAESAVSTGKLRVPVYSQNTNCRVTVQSTSHLPLVLTGAEWEGSYSNRSR